MAVYRQVQTSFWQDTFILELTPEEKYFYLYLLTNSKTTQSGIYELSKKVIELETGYNRETIDRLLGRFTESGKILYNEENQEIMILNWFKYNLIKSSKVISCIKKELEHVKTKAFLRRLYGMDTVSKIKDTLCIDYGEEQEEEEEKEQEEEQKKEQEQEETCCGCDDESLNVDEDLKIVAEHCQKSGFTNLSPVQIEKLQGDIKRFGRDCVIDALSESDRRGKHRIDYVEGILEHWEANGKDDSGGGKGGTSGSNRGHPKEGKTDGNNQPNDGYGGDADLILR